MQNHSTNIPSVGKRRNLPPAQAAREIADTIKRVSNGENVVRATARSLSAAAKLATCSGIYGINKLIADGCLTVTSQAGLPDFVFLLHPVSSAAKRDAADWATVVNLAIDRRITSCAVLMATRMKNPLAIAACGAIAELHKAGQPITAETMAAHMAEAGHDVDAFHEAIEAERGRRRSLSVLCRDRVEVVSL